MPQWSLVKTKEAFVGVGGGDRSTSSPGSFIHHALWKKRVTLVNSQPVASCQSVFLILSLQLCLNYLFLRIWVECLLTRGRRWGGGGGTPKNSWWKCAANWLSKSWTYFRPKNIIFHTRFQNWPLRPGPPYLRVWMAIPPSYLKVWICHCAGQVWHQVVVGSNVSPQNRHYFCCFFLGK